MRDKDATRKRILQAAEKVFSRDGYHQSLVDDIARLSRTSKGAVYFHFPGKDRLFFTVVDGLAAQLIRKVERVTEKEPTALGKSEAALAAVLETLAKHRSLARLLLIQGYSMGKGFERKRQEVFSRFAALIKQNLDLAVAEGSIPPLDTEVAAYAWLGAIDELVVRWLHSSAASLPSDAQATLRALLLRGVGFPAPGAAQAAPEGDRQEGPRA